MENVTTKLLLAGVALGVSLVLALTGAIFAFADLGKDPLSLLAIGMALMNFAYTMTCLARRECYSAAKRLFEQKTAAIEAPPILFPRRYP